jgi:dihydrodipicolinate synthase/N-acetylneuraminate lyase
MTRIPLICRSATTFGVSGAFDQDSFGAHLQRLADCGHGVYLASGASGEGHALTIDEIKDVYRVGVAVCKGKVPVHANQPEQYTARDTIFHAQLAIAAGVDSINLYGPEGRHGYRPTDDEYRAYFDRIFAEVSHQAALAPNPVIGYLPKARTVAQVVASHHEITAVNLAGVEGDVYFVELKDALTRDVDIYVPYQGSAHTLQMGATGLLAAEANIIPQSFRNYLESYERQDFSAMSEIYAGLVRFTAFVGQWKSASPRWLKIALRAFRLPGADGGLREPYLMPGPEVINEFASGAAALGLPEIDEMLQRAAAA